MPIYADKKSGRLYIEFQFKGIRVKERLPEHVTRREAETFEIKLKNDILVERHGIQTKQITFERFVAEIFGPHIEPLYSKDSFERTVHVLKAAMPFFKGKGMRSIKAADVERFQAFRTKLKTQHGTDRKPATVVREMAVISKVFSVAVKNDVCDYNPCSRVTRPTFDNTVDKILTYEDEAKLFANIHGDFTRDVCKFVLNTGLRQNDVLNLTRFNINLNEMVGRITQGKTKRQLKFPINEVTAEILERRMGLKTALLFPSPVTGKNTGRVRHTLRRACERAGIEIVTIRDLRRTYAVRLEFNGVSTGTIAKLLGHSDRRSIHRYERSFDAMREAADSLNKTGNPAAIPQLALVNKRK